MYRRISTLVLLSVLFLTACQRIPSPTAVPSSTPQPSQTPTVLIPTNTLEPVPTPAETTLPLSSYLWTGSLAVHLALDLVWHPASDQVALLGQNEVTVVSIPDLAVVNHFLAPDPNIIYDLSPDMRTAAISADFENIQLVDITTGETLCSIASGRSMGASFSVDGSQLAVSSGEEWFVNLYDVESCTLDQSLTGFETAAPIYNTSLTADPDLIAWIARGTLQYQSISNQTLFPPLHHEDFINAFTTSSVDSVAAVSAAGMIDGEFTPLLTLWELDRGNVIIKLPLPEPAYSLSFFPNHSHIIAIGLTEDIWIWDILTASPPIQRLSANPGGISTLAYSPDGKWLASAGADNQLMLWAINGD